MHIIYHNDLDGQMSAFWTNYFKNKFVSKNEKVYFYPMNHSSNLNLTNINYDEYIIILDYLINDEDMDYLFSYTNNIIWIDHHKSNIDKYKNLNGIRDINYAACSLTYAFFSKIFFQENSFSQDLLKDEPLISKYICDNDIKSRKFKESQDFCFGLEKMFLSKNISFLKLFQKIIDKKIDIDTIILEGKNYKEISLLLVNQQIKKYSYIYFYKGNKFLVINSMYNNFDIEDFYNIDEYDGIINYIYTKNHYIYNIKTKKDSLDVSKIASAFGGGGHQKAAGFSSNKNILET